MNSWIENLINIEPYVPGEQPGDGVIKLNANENPYPPSEKVGRVIREFDYRKLNKYPDSNGTKLKEKLAGYYGLKTSNVSVGNGSDEVLAFIFLACFCSKKPLLFPEITYSFYPVWANLFNKNFEEVPLNPDFSINPDVYYKDNGGIIIPNPNAPTGIGQREGLLRDIIEHNQNQIVIIDEAYSDFGEYSAVGLLKDYDNIIIVKTYSKSRGLAGQRIGVSLSSEKITEKIEAVKNSFNSYTMDSLTLEIAAASIDDEEYFRNCINKIKKTRENTIKHMRKLGFTVMESQANFVFASHDVIGAEDIFLKLKERGIYVRYFNKPKLSNWLRITVGTDEEMGILLRELETICL